MTLFRSSWARLPLAPEPALGVVHSQSLSSSGTGAHIFYRTGWTEPFIHYNTGSAWTTSPGVAMAASNDSTNFPSALGWFQYDLPSTGSPLEIVFNDGNGIWDKNGSANFKVTSGTWPITSTVSPPTSAAVKTKADDGTGLHVYLQTGWMTPYIHYTTDSGWTTPPSVKMSESTDATYPASIGWFKFDFASADTLLEFVFSNGDGVWDNSSSTNYEATSAGTWIVMSTVSLPQVTSTTPTPATTTIPTPTTTPTTP